MTFSEFFYEVRDSINTPLPDNFPIKLGHHQRDILNQIEESKFTAVYKKRQDGISTAVSLYVYWKMLSNPGFQAMIVRHNNIGILSAMIERTSERFGCKVVRNNVSCIRLSNGSALFYSSYRQPDRTRGMALDMIVAEDFGEMVHEKRDRQSILMSFMQCIYGRVGKFVVTTASMTVKDILDDLGFQEVWGTIYYVKRMVLTEKLKRKKS